MSPGAWVRKAGVSVQLYMWSKVPWKPFVPKVFLKKLPSDWPSLHKMLHFGWSSISGLCCFGVKTQPGWNNDPVPTSAPRTTSAFPIAIPCLGWAETSPWASTCLLWCLLQFLGEEAALNSGWITIFLWLMAQGTCPGEDRAVMSPSDSLSHLIELQRLNKFLSHDGVYPNDPRLLMFSICFSELAF